MELAALSVLTIVVAAITVTLTVKSCNDNSGQSTDLRCDSITTIVESRLASPDSLQSIEKNNRKKKKKKAEKIKAPRKQPKQRNYLDEPVNE